MSGEGLQFELGSFVLLPTFPNFSASRQTAKSSAPCKNVGMDKPVTVGSKLAPVHILVVDDHPNTATTLARALSQLGDGVSVISATNGKQALKYASDDTVDVLITDMMMPGMSGLELIEQLQDHPT